MPWSVILMVCGVTVLIGVLSAQRGMDLFTDLLARIATPGTVTFMIALVTGAVSVYSSTSGVVLPAFLPTVPGLAARLGADPLSIAASMYVGGHLVDLSPLSTIARSASGAAEEAARGLFNQLLVGFIDDDRQRDHLLDSVLRAGGLGWRATVGLRPSAGAFPEFPDANISRMMSSRSGRRAAVIAQADQHRLDVY
jgi:hypothetical protein